LAVTLFATAAFMFVQAGTPYAVLIVMMFFRGLGSGLASMPAMVAAFGGPG
jgi:hypothetical protein